jgi:ABC-type sugar transport system ATPase subunit
VASIELRGVSRVFPDGRTGVRDLSLTIADGELLVLVGPSGSGKSTALRLIAGLESPTAGHILIDGRDVTAVPPQERDLAMVFQSYALYPHMTVRDNLAFGLRMRRAAPTLIDARVRQTAAALGIAPLLDRKPAQLSGGERQRVALGRAIVREPQGFLLDEPLSNLDPLLRASTRAELALLHRRLGATMVYVTHDQEEAMTLGTRIAVMRGGAIEQVGPPMELFHRPATLPVATFIGSPAMNLWAGALTTEGGRIHVQLPAGAIDLKDVSVDGSVGREVVLGVRPHDIETVATGGDVTGRVEIVQPLGTATLLHVRGDDRPDDLVQVLVPPDVGLSIGARVWLRFRRDRIHLFDHRTGAAVRLKADTTPS